MRSFEIYGKWSVQASRHRNTRNRASMGLAQARPNYAGPLRCTLGFVNTQIARASRSSGKMKGKNAHKVDSGNQLSWFPGFSHLKLHQIDIPGNVDAANTGTNVLSCFGTGQSHERDRHTMVSCRLCWLNCKKKSKFLRHLALLPLCIECVCTSVFCVFVLLLFVTSCISP